jgi:hypothetical protein
MLRKWIFPYKCATSEYEDKHSNISSIMVCELRIGSVGVMWNTLKHYQWTHQAGAVTWEPAVNENAWALFPHARLAILEWGYFPLLASLDEGWGLHVPFYYYFIIVVFVLGLPCDIYQHSYNVS